MSLRESRWLFRLCFSKLRQGLSESLRNGSATLFRITRILCLDLERTRQSQKLINESRNASQDAITLNLYHRICTRSPLLLADNWIERDFNLVRTNRVKRSILLSHWSIDFNASYYPIKTVFSVVTQNGSQANDQTHHSSTQFTWSFPVAKHHIRLGKLNRFACWKDQFTHVHVNYYTSERTFPRDAFTFLFSRLLSRRKRKRRRSSLD